MMSLCGLSTRMIRERPLANLHRVTQCLKDILCLGTKIRKMLSGERGIAETPCRNLKRPFLTFSASRKVDDVPRAELEGPSFSQPTALALLVLTYNTDLKYYMCGKLVAAFEKRITTQVP